MSDKRQNIIIIGGGAAGIATAREITATLDTNRYRLIVINPRPYYVHLPGLLRTVVTSEGNLENEIFMPWGDSLRGKGEVKVGKVVSFTETKDGGEVVLSDGEKLPYSALVLASGSSWEGPVALPEEPAAALEHLKTWRARFEKAKSVLLVGGGAIGIELAGEIKDFLPGTHVTLVHGGKKLLNEAYPDRYRSLFLGKLRKVGVEVVLGDYVDDITPNDDGVVITRNGKKIQADLVVPTRGPRPNTAIVSSSLGADTLSSSGYVKVLPTLQLPGHRRIFAVGDIIDWKEQKQAAKTGGHAAAVAKNVLSVLEGTEGTVRYKGSSEMIITTIGRNGGGAYMGVLWGLTFGDWFSRMIKSRTLVIEMIRGSLALGRN